MQVTPVCYMQDHGTCRLARLLTECRGQQSFLSSMTDKPVCSQATEDSRGSLASFLLWVNDFACVISRDRLCLHKLWNQYCTSSGSSQQWSICLVNGQSNFRPVSLMSSTSSFCKRGAKLYHNITLPDAWMKQFHQLDQYDKIYRHP